MVAAVYTHDIGTYSNIIKMKIIGQVGWLWIGVNENNIHGSHSFSDNDILDIIWSEELVSRCFALT